MKKSALIIFLFCLAVSVSVKGIGCCKKIDCSFDRVDYICVSKDQKHIIINDSGHSRLIITDRNFKLKKIIAHRDFYNMWGLSVTDSDEIIVTNERPLKVTLSREERLENTVVEFIFFDFNGRELRRLQWFQEKGPVISPSKVCMLRDGTMLVPDTRTNSILKLDSNGRLLHSFGGFGYRGGKLNYPCELLVLPSGEIVVADEYNSRLALFDSQGTFIRDLATRGTEETKVMFPQSLAPDFKGGFYVAEIYTMRISHFNEKGVFTHAINLRNKEEGRNIVQIFGIASATSPEEVLAADTHSSTIFVLEPGGQIKRQVTSIVP